MEKKFIYTISFSIVVFILSFNRGNAQKNDFNNPSLGLPKLKMELFNTYTKIVSKYIYYNFDSIYFYRIDENNQYEPIDIPISDYDITVYSNDTVIFQETFIEGNKYTDKFKQFIKNERSFRMPRDNKYYESGALVIVVNVRIPIDDGEIYFKKVEKIH